jgi:hypothetical protein
VTCPRARECASCAGRGPDTKFLSRRRKSPDLCIECTCEAARNADRNPATHRTPPITRASARARFRSRQKSDQLDLVDLIQAMPPP